ncbi:MAG: MaoC family dehydratase N-terminal domain-containing protein [Candidatus Tectomicrobia bacterium]
MGEHAVITEDALDRLQQRIGVPVHRRHPHVQLASQDAIRHFAHGIGDDNPLWTDPDYAATTRYGCIIAPPGMLYAMDDICSGQFGGLPGIHTMFAGTRFAWFHPIKVNDTITATSVLHSLEEKRSAFARRTILQSYDSTFTNQNGVVVATTRAFGVRAERDAARQQGKYHGIERARYSPEDIAGIEAVYDAEIVRGATPRYWEDVRVGEELTPIVKGPLTVTDIVTWLIGWGGLFNRAHKIGLDFRRRHPAAGVVDAYGVPDGPERVHWDLDFAREVGVPGAYDYGPQRISWFGHLLTNWIGDDGFLSRLEVQVRRFNLVGDTTWLRGTVTDTFERHGNHLITCDVWAENQRGEITAQGQAEAMLPRNSHR